MSKEEVGENTEEINLQHAVSKVVDSVLETNAMIMAFMAVASIDKKRQLEVISALNVILRFSRDVTKGVEYSLQP